MGLGLGLVLGLGLGLGTTRTGISVNKQKIDICITHEGVRDVLRNTHCSGVCIIICMSVRVCMCMCSGKCAPPDVAHVGYPILDVYCAVTVCMLNSMYVTVCMLNSMYVITYPSAILFIQ